MGLVYCSSREPSTSCRVRRSWPWHHKSLTWTHVECHRSHHSQTQTDVCFFLVFFFMRSQVNLLMSAVVFNTECVKKCLQRWRSYPFVILWFVFSELLLCAAPSVCRNEERAVWSELPGSLSQHGGLPQKYAEASTENLHQTYDLFTHTHTKEDTRAAKTCLNAFSLFFIFLPFFVPLFTSGGPKVEI